ncbi:MAG: hypothetical protein KDB02_03840 [Acidimicrobiales bacterium]|nr:hypothetical protein [Acidimicrobiales bacterium]
MKRAIGGLAALLCLLASLAISSPASAHTPHDDIVDIEVSPTYSKDHTVYTISRQYLLKSTDEGKTWHRLNRGLDNRTQLSGIETSEQDPKTLYASTRGDGVFRSDDAGHNWVRTAVPSVSGNVLALRVSPVDDRLVFTTHVAAGLSRSTDGGNSWNSVPEFKNREVGAVAFGGDDPTAVWAGVKGAVYRSDDDGTTWRKVGSDLGGEKVQAIVVPSGGDENLLVGTTDGLYRLEGTKFVPSADGIDDDRITALLSRGSETIAVSWSDGPYVSTDGGHKWHKDAEGVTTNIMATDLGHPDFDDIAAAHGTGGDRTLFLAGFDGLFRSDGVDEKWSEVQTQDSLNITGLDLSPDYAKDRSVLVTTYVNGPKLSTDAGKSWKSLGAGVAFEYDYLRRPDYYVRLTGSLFAPDYATTGRMFTMTRGVFFSTDDPGVPWKEQPAGALVDPDLFPPDYLIPDFSPQYAKDHTLYAGTDRGLILKRVGDEPFVKIGDLGKEIVALVVSPDFAKDKTFFAATDDGLYAGDPMAKGNRGMKLIAGSPKRITSLAVSPNLAKDGTIFVGTEMGLFVTRDEGKTWKEVPWSAGRPKPVIESVVLSPAFADDGFALVSERGHGLFRTTDGGRKWAPTGEDLFDRDVVLSSFYHPTGEPIVFSPDFAKDRTVYGIAQTTLYRSTDAGESWTAIDLPRQTHPTTRKSAPNELLHYPGNHDSNLSGMHAARSADGRDMTILFLTWKRFLMALAAAAIVFLGLTFARVERRLPQRVLTLAFRAACGLAVFVAALYFIGRRT